MTLLLEAALKISLLIALGLMAVAFLRRHSAALRHWMLATAIAAALAAPMLMAVAPAWRLPVDSPLNLEQPRAPQHRPHREPRVRVTTSIQDAPTTAVSTETIRNRASAVVMLWFVGAAINLGGLLIGFRRLHRTAARATIVHDGPWADAARVLSGHFGLRRPVRLLQSDQPAVLVTWGLLTPKVLLPIDAMSWDADRIRVVLAHELAHVQRHDWIIQIGSELLRIVCWFNPLVWLASSRLRLESERACDDAVVNLGVNGRDYATHLLELARQFGRARQIFPAVAIVPRPSSLERRVTAMLNAHLSRRPVSRTVRLVTLMALLAVAVPIALFAQNTFATISGTIVDQSGAVLPGVTVVAVDRDRQARREVVTDAAGRFEIVGVPQGRHTLQAELPGFQSFAQQLTVSGQDVHREITMHVGTLQETISVSNTPDNSPGRPLPDYRAAKLPPNCGPGVGRGAPVGANGIRPVRVGGQIRAPRKLFHVSPIYPQGSSAGRVTMNVLIGVDGIVKETNVTNSAPPALAQSAIDAVQRWEFDPTLLNCVPVEVRMTVTVDFL
jgi:beta-lactamase regulating signal transducer with metallopeptidase domain